MPLKIEKKTTEIKQNEYLPSSKQFDDQSSTFIIEQKLVAHEKDITDLTSNLDEKNRLIESLLSQMNETESNTYDGFNNESSIEKSEITLQKNAIDRVENNQYLKIKQVENRSKSPRDKPVSNVHSKSPPCGYSKSQNSRSKVVSEKKLTDPSY